MWIKLDDRFLLNPKVMSAGLHARALYVASLCYASGELTDGFIPNPAVRKLGVLADVADPERAAERLIEVGLWEICDGGYQIHDYLEYNPTKTHVLEVRQARAEAGQRGGKQRASNLLSKSQANAKQNPSRSRTRTPSPSQQDSPSVHPVVEGGDQAPPQPPPTAEEAQLLGLLESTPEYPADPVKDLRAIRRCLEVQPYPMVRDAFTAWVLAWEERPEKRPTNVRASLFNWASVQRQRSLTNGTSKNGLRPAGGRALDKNARPDEAERDRIRAARRGDARA